MIEIFVICLIVCSGLVAYFCVHYYNLDKEEEDHAWLFN